MLERLKAADILVGVKQTKRALIEGRAECVFIAENAATNVTEPILALCREKDVQHVLVPTTQELGRACDIEVGAAAAVILR